MSNGSHIPQFTAADIERYHRGLLSAAEMHALEKAALEDPFLADALDGYAEPAVEVETDLADLQTRLAKRLEEKEETKVVPLGGGKRQLAPWWKAAAAAVLLVGGAAVYLQLRNTGDNTSTPIAQASEKEQPHIDAKDKKETPATTGNGLFNPDSLTGQQSVAKTGNAAPALNNTEAITQSQSPETAKEINAPATEQAAPVAVPATSEPATTITPVPADQNGLIARNKKEVADKQAQDDALARQSQQREVAKTRELTDNNRALSQEARRKQALRDVTSGQENNSGYTNNNAVAYNYNRQYNQRANVFRGRVTDPDNNALPFANITNPADNIGTYADANGNFVLTSPDSVLNVQVRSVGFENRQYFMRSQTPSNQITLQEDRSLNARVLDTIRRVRAVASNTMVHEEPEPADGWNNYDTYIANNLQIPETVRMMDIGSSSAEVEVSFDVNKYGQPVNIKIVRSTCTKCEQEAIRLIKEGPRWKKKGRKSKTRVTLSF